MRLAAVSAFFAAFAAAVWFLAPTPTTQSGVWPVGPQPHTPRSPRFAIVDRFGSPFLTDGEIAGYEWATHTITLRSSDTLQYAWDRCKSGIGNGVPFTLVADGVTCYRGVFIHDTSSVSHAAPIIYLDPPRAEPAVLKIELGKPRSYFKCPDPRDDERIRAALRAVGKLRE